MDVSLGALRQRMLDFRAWDSTGTSFDNRVREAINTALDRLAGDIPEALIPSEEHIVLLPDVLSSTYNLKINATSESRVLKLTDTSGVSLGLLAPASPLPDTTAQTWYLNDFKVDGTWDGTMHLEIKDGNGVWHRRQTRECFRSGSDGFITIDRPWPNSTDTLMEFRIHQPEFFMTDDVMEVLEPARIYDSTRQQVWGIDTAGAYRQDMVDFQGETKGRPYRFWRGRHFQIPAPRRTPTVEELKEPLTAWAGPVFEGTFRFCYTYVWGKRDEEWQTSPEGIRDPQWESAPSPISTVTAARDPKDLPYALRIRAANIDAMTGFGALSSSALQKETRSGYRIRFYVARDSVLPAGTGEPGWDNVESAGIFYLLAEVDPATVDPTASYTWNGSVVPDYERPLKHSTGYYAWKTYPHQDARYELDFRVLRMPRKFVHDQDTAPIQRDAVSALLELALHYLCLVDGVDQSGAMAHMERYKVLARRYRHRYANPGGIVEPTPVGGHTIRRRFSTFANE
jgi:hypothetical protein